MEPELRNLCTLAEAAAELGLSPSTLKIQAQKGAIAARLLGKTWITTTAEVERYRREHLGKVGRPKGRSRQE